MNLWEIIKLHYKYQFNISPDIVDYISVRPLLIKCLSGYSNYRIAFYTKESIKYISDILFKFLDFNGWNMDLDFNPIAYYNKVKGNLINFREEILMASSTADIKLIDKSFYLCKYFYNKIEKRIKEYDRVA